MTPPHPMTENNIHPMRGRLAGAIQAAIEHEWGAIHCGDAAWGRVVIAVLRTLKEPDERMMAAGQRIMHGYEDMRSTYAHWQAMITSILPEEKGTET